MGGGLRRFFFDAAAPCPGGGFFFGAGARVFFFVADDDRDDADRDDDRGAACFVARRPRRRLGGRRRRGRLGDFESREAGRLDALAELSRDAGRLAGGVWALSRGSASGSGRGSGSGSGSGRTSARFSLSFFTFSRSVRPRSAAQSRVAAAASSASPGGGSIVRRSADGPPTSATRARPTSSQGEGPCTACVSRSRRAFSDALSFRWPPPPRGPAKKTGMTRSTSILLCMCILEPCMAFAQVTSTRRELVRPSRNEVPSRYYKRALAKQPRMSLQILAPLSYTAVSRLRTRTSAAAVAYEPLISDRWATLAITASAGASASALLSALALEGSREPVAARLGRACRFGAIGALWVGPLLAAWFQVMDWAVPGAGAARPPKVLMDQCIQGPFMISSMFVLAALSAGESRRDAVGKARGACSNRPGWRTRRSSRRPRRRRGATRPAAAPRVVRASDEFAR
ncbi:peroxisomal membrane protein [Aureococcus anophagefferens]|uniref:Peroxisomal membrane protein n=1 Tax=Aureococcus anophagefferens TaxID=44056 RepID=A0ABR1G9G9_AURAN